MNTPKQNLQISELSDLYKAYMPFIKKGGLFIATTASYQLHQEITLCLQLLQENEVFMLAGRVIWLTPENAQGGRKAGIGVQLTSPSAKIVVQKIESYLKNYQPTNSITDTI